MSNDRHTAPSLERLARRRVGLKLGLLVHTTVFVLVNGGLWALGRHPGFALGGWGLALAIHATVVFVKLTVGHDLRERLVASEMERLSRR